MSNYSNPAAGVGSTTLTTTTGSDPAVQAFVSISSYLQIVLSFPAVFLNLAVFVTYVRQRSLLPPSARVVLINQAFLEMCCAAFAIILKFTKTIKPVYLPGGVFGDIICNIWNDFYWCVMSAVELNCVVVTVDRFLAVCFPMKRLFTRRVALVAVVLANLFAFSVVIINLSMLVRYDVVSRSCPSLPISRSSQIALGVLQLVVLGVLPVLAVVTLYPPMVYAIYASGKQLGGSGNVDKVRSAASNRLIRTCFIAALALIVSIMPDVVFFYVFTLIMGIPRTALMSAIEVTFASIYPLLSPIIYSFSTQKFRKAMIESFRC